jgi:hypothetical protein
VSQRAASPATPIRLLVPVLILLALGSGSPPCASDALPQLCKLILHEETNERETFELELDVARTNLLAAKDVFSLVDELWKEDAFELLGYLGYKRDRDHAVVDEKRAQVVLARQDVLLEEARLLCDTVGSDEATEERREAIARAHVRYLALDCERLGHRIDMAKVELDYAVRVRDAYIDLREYAAAAAIDVMVWNYNVEIAHKKLAHAKRRTASCQAALGSPAKAGE